MNKIKKILSEFKAFINKGSVMDLAVGIIIGSAFTAIVTSLVNGILKPLINAIPITDTGLQTVIRPAVTDANGTILTEAVILDWGSVISSIITFLLTAVVLFLIVKIFNKVVEANNKAKDVTLNLMKNIKEDIEKKTANTEKSNEEKISDENEVKETEESAKLEQASEEELNKAEDEQRTENIDSKSDNEKQTEEKTETTEDLLRKIITLLENK